MEAGLDLAGPDEATTVLPCSQGHLGLVQHAWVANRLAGVCEPLHQHLHRHLVLPPERQLALRGRYLDQILPALEPESGLPVDQDGAVAKLNVMGADRCCPRVPGTR